MPVLNSEVFPNLPILDADTEGPYGILLRCFSYTQQMYYNVLNTDRVFAVARPVHRTLFLGYTLYIIHFSWVYIIHFHGYALYIVLGFTLYTFLGYTLYIFLGYVTLYIFPGFPIIGRGGEPKKVYFGFFRAGVLSTLF